MVPHKQSGEQPRWRQNTCSAPSKTKAQLLSLSRRVLGTCVGTRLVGLVCCAPQQAPLPSVLHTSPEWHRVGGAPTYGEGDVLVSKLFPQFLHKPLPDIFFLSRGNNMTLAGVPPGRRGGQCPPPHPFGVRTLSSSENSIRSSWLQLLPIGDTFNIPLRNSMNVPLCGGQAGSRGA